MNLKWVPWVQRRSGQWLRWKQM